MKALSEIYAAGYAIPAYTIETEIQLWRYEEKIIARPFGAVPMKEIPGLPFHVARIEDVCRV